MWFSFSYKNIPFLERKSWVSKKNSQRTKYLVHKYQQVAQFRFAPGFRNLNF